MSLLVQLREQMVARAGELDTLREKAERSADDETRLDALLAELNDLGPQLERETRLAEQSRAAAGLTRTSNGYLPIVSQDTAHDPASTQHQTRRRQTDPGNHGRRFIESEEFQAFRKHPHGNGAHFGIGSTYEPLRRRDDGPDEQRTLIYTGATTNGVPPQRLAGINGPSLMPFQVRMRDVLTNGTTDSGSVQFVKELAFTNAAVEVAEAVSTVTGAKPESALTFVVATAPVATIAHWVPITRQALDDMGQVETYVNARLIDGLKLREDAEIIAGDGTGANLTGLLSTSGIGDLNAAYWTANPLPTTGAAANKLDRIRRAKKYVRVTGLAEPTFVVLHPDDLEAFDELKDTTGDYIVGDPVAYNTIPRLWGLTVVESTSITAGNFLVGAGNQAVIFDRMDAQIFMSESHSDFFIRNMVVLLAEERLALAVLRPSAFAKGAFA